MLQSLPVELISETRASSLSVPQHLLIFNEAEQVSSIQLYLAGFYGAPRLELPCGQVRDHQSGSAGARAGADLPAPFSC